MLSLKERRARKAVWPADLKSQIADLKSTAESCSRQLRGWADSLQNSDITGQRHLNRRTREQEEQTKKAKTLQKDLLRKLPSGHPLRRDAEERGLTGDLKFQIRDAPQQAGALDFLRASRPGMEW